MEAYQVLGLAGLCFLGLLFGLVFALSLCKAAADGDAMIAREMERRLDLATGEDGE